MLTSYFGVGLQLTDDSATPAVAINRNGGITLVDTVGDAMRYRFGTPNQATIDWRGTVEYDEGKGPTVANNQAGVVEVHNSGSSGRESDLWWNVGVYVSSGIDWKTHAQMYRGTHPSIAMDDGGRALLVYEDPDDPSQLSYVGMLFYPSSGTVSNFTFGTKFEHGSRPTVAITLEGMVLLAFERDGRIWTSVGSFVNGYLTMNPAAQHTKGSHPAVGLTQDGYFVIAYQQTTKEGPVLREMSGIVQKTSVSVTANGVFDVGGTYPTVSAYDKLAVQVHQGPSNGIYFSTARVENRTDWMRQYLSALGGRTLRNLVLPASHDAAMYRTPRGTAWIAQTQDQRLLGQLNGGIRWFDLRLTRYQLSSTIVTHHGDVPGPPLKAVLADVRQFIKLGHRELIILKLSHFTCPDVPCSYGDEEYQTTVKQVTNALGNYLYKTPLPAGTTLGEVTLQQYLSGSACVLVVVDGDFASRFQNPGFWVYRDESAGDVAKGQLRVYDHYSDTEDFGKMKSEQLSQFAGFTGKCSGDKSGATTCDLFLLSWTLTPNPSITHVPPPLLKLAVRADSQLGASMVTVPIPNSYQRIINLVYVDYVELARATDVALDLNGV